MMKKFLFCLVLAAVLLAGYCFAAAEGNVLVSRYYTVGGETEEGPDFEYELLPDGSARIIYCAYVKSGLVIPETVDGFPVSELGERSVPEGFGVLRIAIPDCVTTVCPNAFGNVHCVVRPEVSDTHPTLKVVDGVLICPGEKRVIRGEISGEYRIPEGIEIIDDYAFSGCHPKSVYIPESVARLGRNPFALCSANMDTYNALQEVTLSPYNTALEIRDGALFSKADRRLVWCFAPDYTLGEHPQYEIPDGIEVIDDFAFTRWRLLESLTIPASVTQIGVNPFYGMRYPQGVRLADGNDAFVIADGMLISRTDRRIVFGLCSAGRITVPEGTEIIGDYAFVTNTVEGSFVYLPDSVKEIGTRAFYISDVRIPSGVRIIRDYAFANGMVKELPVFDGGVVIGDSAFGGCTWISSLTVNGGAKIRAYAFSGCLGLEEVSVSGPSRIGPSAFASCGKLRTVDLGEGVKELGNGAFMMCDRLEEVSLPASLEWIGVNALLNGADRQYNEQFDTYMVIYRSTAHVTVPRGSYAERYCVDNEVNYTAR